MQTALIQRKPKPGGTGDCPEIKRHIKQNADPNFKTGGYGKLGINQLCHWKNLDEIETNISNMKTKLDDIETRYYKKFSALDTALEKLNSQSSYLTSMLGSSTS